MVKKNVHEEIFVHYGGTVGKISIWYYISSYYILYEQVGKASMIYQKFWIKIGGTMIHDNDALTKRDEREYSPRSVVEPFNDGILRARRISIPHASGVHPHLHTKVIYDILVQAYECITSLILVGSSYERRIT
jgi:hypothetical protein